MLLLPPLATSPVARSSGGRRTSYICGEVHRICQSIIDRKENAAAAPKQFNVQISPRRAFHSGKSATVT